jgi:hypothetical protein
VFLFFIDPVCGFFPPLVLVLELRGLVLERQVLYQLNHISGLLSVLVVLGFELRVAHL